MRIAPVLLIAFGSLAAVACQWLVTIEAAPEPPPEAGADVPPPPRGPVSACDDPATITRPITAAAQAETNLDFAFSFIAFNPGELDAGGDFDLCPTAGFDLDGRHTCFDDAGERTPEEECPGPDKTGCSWGPTCTRSDRKVQCDESNRGEDTAIGKLLTNAIKSVPSEVSGALDFARVFRKGEGNVLIRILGYNEQPDDSEVAVSFYRSSGLARDSALVNDGGAEASVEVWDGLSRREWTLDPLTLAPNSDTPTFSPATGFVRNHVLVVTAGSVLLPGILDVTVRDVMMMGELRRTTAGGWAIARGRIGGRLTSNDLMRAMLVAPVRTGNVDLKGFCLTEEGPLVVQSYVCPYRDLGTNGGKCTDVSFGVAFTAVPAVFGQRRSSGFADASCPFVIECP